jgi:NADH:ubiquinone oxidoreductase subunit K
MFYGYVAQLVEHAPFKRGVLSSNLSVSNITIMMLTTISLVLFNNTVIPFHIEFSLSSVMDCLMLLTGLGVLGVYTNRTMLLLSVISIELMLFGVNLIFVVGSLYLNDIGGEIAATFILTLAGGESALALALIMAYFRVHGNIFINDEQSAIHTNTNK